MLSTMSRRRFTGAVGCALVASLVTPVAAGAEDDPIIEEADPFDGPEIEVDVNSPDKLNLDGTFVDGSGVELWQVEPTVDPDDILDPDSASDGPGDADSLDDLEELDELQTRGLWTGPWTGFVSITGGGTASVGGGDFSFDADFYGGLEFEVDGDNVIDGVLSISGPYSVQGQTGSGSIDGQLTFSATGTISGSGLEPTIAASGTSSGVMTVSGGGADLNRSVAGQPADFIDYTVQMDSMVCNEAAGSFTAPLAIDVAAEGWSPTAVGTIVAIQDTAVIDAGIDAYIAQADASSLQNSDIEIPEYVPPILLEIGDLIRRFNDWADTINGGNYDVETMIDLMHDWEVFNAALRNLSECSERLLGSDRIELFETIMMNAVAAGVRDISEAPQLTSAQLAQATYAALNVGAIGSGAARPAEAMVTEGLLRTAAQRLFDGHLDPVDGKMWINEDSRTLVALSAQMGWQFLANGELIGGIDIARRLAAVDAQGAEG